MALTKNEFNVLAAIACDGVSSQRQIAEARSMSLGSVNAAYRKACEKGWVDAFSLTEEGCSALAPYKVDNAIIMAAGLSSRFAPISYERPKGVLTVRGEVLIERQIRQLKEAGINDITVVVGYMKEAFFYLEDLFGVAIRVNEHYAERNNNSTLMLVREKLGNTYICSSDDYFESNVFSSYEYKAYYSTSYFDGPTDEWVVTTGAGGRITHVSIGGSDGWAMLGHVYFDRAFSQAFVRFLEADYDLPETAPKLWEEIYIDHIKDLDMVERRYPDGVIYEFDSLADLQRFDRDFIDNVDSAILDNICSTLSCERSDISNIVPIKQGLTNLSFRFEVEGARYVYRHPGAGTDAIINRKSEAFSQGVAARLGIDSTFIYEDPDEGWKVSRFVDDCVEFDYHEPWHVERAMKIARTLHECGCSSEFDFNIYEATSEIIGMLGAAQRTSFKDFEPLRARNDELALLVAQDGVAPVLCHNDFYAPNFLVAGDRIDLIDWEYSGMSDYASDLGTFICCSDYTYDEALSVLETYFGRPLSSAELFHCVAYVALSGFYWFIWALYKDMCGDPVGEWLYLWYRYAKTYGQKAHELACAMGRLPEKAASSVV